MTITLERPPAEIAYLDERRPALYPVPDDASGATVVPLPRGVRLVQPRKGVATPTLTLGRKLAMLAPAALLAAVAGGTVTLAPHAGGVVDGVVDGVRHLFDDGGAAAPVAHQQEAAPKHRAATAPTTGAGAVTHRPKHRATGAGDTAPTTGPQTGSADAGSASGTPSTPSAGTHKGSSTGSVSATRSGGKHAATGSDDTSSSTQQSSTPKQSQPKDSQPKETEPKDTTPSDPVSGTVDTLTNTVDDVVGGVTGGLGLGG
ncbi:hypothetical protein [Nocardioides sp. KR10-350]|uniref:hypothetical protein n=1 Tax=Nocardioides cheoyonin TaxID=3156615 RepID=UPI0032B5BB3E